MAVSPFSAVLKPTRSHGIYIWECKDVQLNNYER